MVRIRAKGLVMGSSLVDFKMAHVLVGEPDSTSPGHALFWASRSNPPDELTV
jgi:hypothetical protein